MVQELVLLLSIVFAVIGVGEMTISPVIAAYSIQQVQSTKQQWRTYTDDDGEFTIEYPVGYKVTEINKTETDGTNINGVIFKHGPSAKPFLSFILRLWD